MFYVTRRLYAFTCLGTEHDSIRWATSIRRSCETIELVTMINPNRNSILPRIIGPYEEYCVGFGDHTSRSADNQGNYLLAVCMGTGRTPRRFHHIGSNTLDSIIAFDSAEV